MAKLVTAPLALKMWLTTIGAIALYMFGDHLSQRLISDPGAAETTRWLGVIIGTFCLIPLLVIIVGAISGSDEYVRQVALRGTAVGFVAYLFTHVAYALLQDARLVSWSSHLLPIPAAAGSWLFGIAATFLYLRFRP